MAGAGYSCLLLAALLGVATHGADIFHPTGRERARALTREEGNVASDVAKEKYTPPEEMDTRFWMEQAERDLLKRLRAKPNMRRAKNIVFFMGDGMSIASLTAARIHKGQRLGGTGEEARLVVEDFPYAGLSKTYCTNGQTPDSACTATAYLCGVKTNLLMIGLNAHADFNNCSASADPANHVQSIATWAQRAGKATGIVTTTTVTHASPSASYAHVANRMWETDADMVEHGADMDGGCADIATQLITQQPGRDFDVILGGGASKFLPSGEVDAFGAPGMRLDGVNLIERWRRQNPRGAVVHTREELLGLDLNATDRVFGTFNTNNMAFHLEAAQKRPTQPRLKEMTEAAIRVLRKNPNGYFVFVEGGLIDYGHHYTRAGLALDETLELDEAIGAALAMTSPEDTLVVVTSDHSHTMSIAGYPGRGNPILGANEYDADVFGTPYKTLNYAVGLEQFLNADGTRQDPRTLGDDELGLTPSYIKAASGTHAGEDVGVFASGPHAHLFSGIMQQNLIPHLMAYAARLDTRDRPKPTGPNKCRVL